MTLAFLAGARMCDILYVYSPISESESYRSIWLTIDAINDAFAIEFPMDDESLKEMERGFRCKSREQVWKGCVGAVDGIHFAMRCPGVAVDSSDRFYVDRKAKFAILVMAVVDSDGRFTFWEAK